MHTQAQIDTAAGHIEALDEPWVSNWGDLQDYANARIAEPTNAVVNFAVPNSYSDPTGFAEMRDNMLGDARAAYALALMYSIQVSIDGGVHPSSNAAADKVASILDAWASTNTNIPGPGDATYPESCLVVSYCAPGFLNAAELIWDYPGWLTTPRGTFKTWVGGTLYTAASALKDRGLYSTPRSFNRNNCWAVLLALQISYFTENSTRLDGDIVVLEDLIKGMIGADGRLPTELALGATSIASTGFALEALVSASEVVRNAGRRELFYFGAPSGFTLKDALVFLFDRGLEDDSLWPRPDARGYPSNIPNANEVISASGFIYNVAEWKTWTEKPPVPDDVELGWFVPELLRPAVTTAPVPPTGGTKWHPGHFVRFVYDITRPSTDEVIIPLKNRLANPKAARLTGCLLQINWASIEPSFHSFNFGIVDQFIDLCAAKGKYTMLFVIDKSFHSGSCGGVIPSYLPSEINKKGRCQFQRWHTSAPGYVADFYAKLGERYNKNPWLSSISGWGETTAQIYWTNIDPDTKTAQAYYRDKLIAMYQGIKTGFPNTVVYFGVSFPTESFFLDPIFREIRDVHPGGGVTWPDTAPGHLGPRSLHYRLARDNAHLIPVIPMTQAALVPVDGVDTIYDFLFKEIKAHGAIWNLQHADAVGDYFDNYVYPVLQANDWKYNTVVPEKIKPIST